jgi:hypothetical protein
MKKLKEKNKLNLNFNVFTNLKQKICNRIIVILSTIMQKCGGAEMQDHLKKFDKERQDSHKYHKIMQQKDDLLFFISQLDMQKNESQQLHLIVANTLNNVNVLMHNNKYKDAHNLLTELLSKYKIQTEKEI